jgi:hypothetical protein
MQTDGIEPQFPECVAHHLAEYLFEIGPTIPAGMGEGPISQLEIAAWQANTGVELTRWDVRTLRRLSIAYLMEAQKAKSPACPSPLAVVMSDEVRQKKLPKLIREALRG